jgi:F420-0:gamma-glutamyl ligase
MNKKEVQVFIMDIKDGMEARAEYANGLTPVTQAVDAEDLYGEQYVFFRELFVDMLTAQFNEYEDKSDDFPLTNRNS